MLLFEKVYKYCLIWSFICLLSFFATCCPLFLSWSQFVTICHILLKFVTCHVSAHFIMIHHVTFCDIFSLHCILWHFIIFCDILWPLVTCCDICWHNVTCVDLMWHFVPFWELSKHFVTFLTFSYILWDFITFCEIFGHFVTFSYILLYVNTFLNPKSFFIFKIDKQLTMDNGSNILYHNVFVGILTFYGFYVLIKKVLW